MRANFRLDALKLLGLGLAIAAGSLVNAAAPSIARANPGEAGQVIPANDPRFRYEGRIDFADPAAPALIWQGSRVSLDFDGDRIALRFRDGSEPTYFNAQVDGTNTVIEVRAGSTADTTVARVERIELPPPAGPGRHHLVIFKRNEAASGHVRFAGVEIAPGALAWAPPAPAYKLRMEFFGDSITVGACNEDGATDQWEHRATHNNALSYSTLTASAFAADYRCLAISGMGVATGWVQVKAGQVWDRLYPSAGAQRVDLTKWQPDVAFLNLGENDDSFPKAHGQAFPADYTANYVALVKAFRAAYPQAHIVLLRGGMFGGAKSEPLRLAWTAAVTALEAEDRDVSDFVFTHWSANHPRVSDDRALADELIAWLKVQPFMRRFL